MISETKKINTCDAKKFTTISYVDTKGFADQIKCTYEMEFEFNVNQRLLTKFMIDFPNPLISKSINNNKTWR